MLTNKTPLKQFAYNQSVNSLRLSKLNLLKIVSLA